MLQGSGWIVSKSCWFNCAVSLELAVYWWCFSVAVFLSLIFISSHLDRYKMINRYFFTNCYSIARQLTANSTGAFQRPKQDEGSSYQEPEASWLMLAFLLFLRYPRPWLTLIYQCWRSQWPRGLVARASVFIYSWQEVLFCALYCSICLQMSWWWFPPALI